MRLPIRARLTAWYALFLAAILVCFGAFLVIKLRSDLNSTIDREVRSSSAAIRQGYHQEGATGFRETSAVALRRSGSAAQVLDPTGRRDPVVRRRHRRGSDARGIAADPRARGRSEAAQRRARRLGPLVPGARHAGDRRAVVLSSSSSASRSRVSTRRSARSSLLLLIAGPVALALTAGSGLAARAQRAAAGRPDAQEGRTDRHRRPVTSA